MLDESACSIAANDTPSGSNFATATVGLVHDAESAGRVDRVVRRVVVAEIGAQSAERAAPACPTVRC